MPIVRDFIYGEDEETGLIGLTPIWIQGANATTAIAHDVLEHSATEKGNAFEAEMRALGCLLAVRLENGAFSTNLSGERHLASLVYGVLVDWVRCEEDTELTAPSTRALKGEFEYAETLIQAALPLALSMTLEDLSDLPEEQARVRGRNAQITAAVTSLLRLGYRDAYQRYRGADIYTVGSHLFRTLDKASQKLIAQASLRTGDLVRVVVHLKSMVVSIKVNNQSVEELAW